MSSLLFSFTPLYSITSAWVLQLKVHSESDLLSLPSTATFHIKHFWLLSGGNSQGRKKVSVRRPQMRNTTNRRLSDKSFLWASLSSVISLWSWEYTVQYIAIIWHYFYWLFLMKIVKKNWHIFQWALWHEIYPLKFIYLLWFLIPKILYQVYRKKCRWNVSKLNFKKMYIQMQFNIFKLINKHPLQGLFSAFLGDCTSHFFRIHHGTSVWPLFPGYTLVYRFSNVDCTFCAWLHIRISSAAFTRPLYWFPKEDVFSIGSISLIVSKSFNFI